MTVLRLEEFDTPSATVPSAAEPPSPDSGAEAAARIAGYEEGYRTGWDDAARAAEEDATALGAELARNLRDLSFTYFEARDEVLAALRPFLDELLDTMFPDLLAEATAAAIAAEVADGFGAAGQEGPRVLVAPEDVAVVRALRSQAGTEVEIVGEPAMASGQARLTAGGLEARIDTGAVAERLRAGLAVADPGAETVTPAEEPDHAVG